MKLLKKNKEKDILSVGPFIIFIIFFNSIKLVPVDNEIYKRKRNSHQKHITFRCDY